MQDYYVNDIVSFRFRGQTRRGTLARLNPKRARVLCDNGEAFSVPYELLKRDAANPLPTHRDTAKVAGLAEELMNLHGLADWVFEFDSAKRRSGACHYGRKTISLAFEFARTAPDEEIADTILHEIAHALVGATHGHGPAWRTKAREIGCSARRCHNVEFSQPLYRVRCRNGCFSGTANRQRRNVVCKACGGPIDYAGYVREAC